MAKEFYVHLKGRAIPLGKKSPISTLGINSINLKINDTIQLPAMSGMDIIVQAPPLNVIERYWLAEATQQETSFIVANTVVTPWKSENFNIPVRLVNLSPIPVTIRKDTNVPQLNQLDNNSIVNTIKVQSSSVDDPPPTVLSHTEQVLWDMVEQSDVNLSDSQQQQLYTLLLGYSDIFVTKDSNLGRATM